MTALTGPTQFTGNNTIITQSGGYEIDKNASLVEYVHLDPTLSREQNISLGRESSLTNTDLMKISGGVKMTQFAPYKVKLHEDDSASIDDACLTFDAKMEARQRS